MTHPIASIEEDWNKLNALVSNPEVVSQAAGNAYDKVKAVVGAAMSGDPEAAAKVTWFVGSLFVGPETLAAKASVATKVETTVAGAADDVLRTLAARIRQQAGFAGQGLPIILDENVMQRGLARALRERGHNVRDISEIFGKQGIKDPEIINLANIIGARVLTNNVKDFGRRLAIPLPRSHGWTAEGVEQFIKYYTR